MEIAIVIFKRWDLIEEIKEKDDIRLFEITWSNKRYLFPKLLKEVGMGVPDLRGCLISELMWSHTRGIEGRKPRGPSSSIMKKLKWL
jgi:hypothetical protein